MSNLLQVRVKQLAQDGFPDAGSYKGLKINIGL